MEIKTELLEETGWRPGECGVMKEVLKGKSSHQSYAAVKPPKRD